MWHYQNADLNQRKTTAVNAYKGFFLAQKQLIPEGSKRKTKSKSRFALRMKDVNN